MAKKSLLSLIEDQMNLAPAARVEKKEASISFIPDDLILSVKDFLSSPANYEVELSFGTFKEGDDVYFIPGAISVWQYSVLNKTLRDLVEKGIATFTDEKTDVEVMQNLPRGDQRAFYRKIRHEDGSAVWENKKRDRRMLENRFWGYRISRSEEQRIQKPPFDEKSFNPNFVRHRRRFSFLIKGGSNMAGFRFDLSHIIEDITKGQQTYSKTKYEIEIERVSTSLSVDVLFNNLSVAIAFTIKAMQGTVNESQLISLPERLRISKIHAAKYPSKHENPYKLYKDYWNKPMNVEIKDLLNPKLNQYSITLKLDGVRRFIMFSNEAPAIYALSPPDDAWKIGSAINMGFTLLDTELYDNNYYAFDIIYHDGADVSEKSFRERLLLLEKTVKVMKGNLYGSDITVKQYYGPPVGFYENVRKAFDKMDTASTTDSKIKYDGLILQPPGSYKNNATRKWKPESEMTIDFYISKKGLKDSGEYEYALWVGVNKDIVRFEGNRKYPYAKTVVIPGGRFDGMNVEGVIIEFVWDAEKENFVPKRIREDRDRPNAKTTAEDVWRDIMEPISRNVMEGDTLDVMRKYHNDIKRRMLEETLTEGESIIDIGSGKGGDLAKWKDIGLSKVFVIEPSEEHLKEMERRAVNMGLGDLYQIVQLEDGTLAGAQDGDDILAAVGDSRITAIVAFFSLTFFGKDRELFDKLISSIDQNLPQDAKLIGIVMDGERVKQELANEKIEEGYAAAITTPSYTLEQVTKFSDKYEDGKNEIEIDIKGAATVHKQTEWLFYYTAFKDALAKKGIREERTSILDKGAIFDVLPKDSQRFSSMYRTFVFNRAVKPKAVRSKVIEPDDLIPFPQGSDLYKEDLAIIEVSRDRSSFIRAVIRAFDREYFSRDAKGRTEYINKIRGMLSRKAKDLELYASLNEGEIERVYTDAELYNMGVSAKQKPTQDQQARAEEVGQLRYRLKIADQNEHLSYKDILDLMSKVLGINILVLKANGEKIGMEEFKHERKTVVIVYDGIYYSLLSKKTEDGIYTLFESRDTLIKKIEK